MADTTLTPRERVARAMHAEVCCPCDLTSKWDTNPKESDR